MAATTKANNRAVTLVGANRIFEKVGIEFRQNTDLGFYHCQFQGQGYQAKTLTGLCQKMTEVLLASA